MTLSLWCLLSFVVTALAIWESIEPLLCRMALRFLYFLLLTLVLWAGEKSARGARNHLPMSHWRGICLHTREVTGFVKSLGFTNHLVKAMFSKFQAVKCLFTSMFLYNLEYSLWDSLALFSLGVSCVSLSWWPKPFQTQQMLLARLNRFINSLNYTLNFDEN